MKLSMLLSIVGVVALLFGIGFVVAPVPLLSQYGIIAEPATAFMSRFFGAALINLGVLLWAARHIGDSIGRSAIVLAGLIGDAVGFVIALHGQLNGLANALGWSTVVIYGLFTLGFARFQFTARSA